MTAFILGMAGALVSLGLLAGGFALGWRERDRSRTRAAAELDQAQQRRLEEEQRAFRQLMTYSAETAYGMTGTEEGADL